MSIKINLTSCYVVNFQSGYSVELSSMSIEARGAASVWKWRRLWNSRWRRLHWTSTRNAWPSRWLRIPYKRDKPPTRTLETVGGNWINASLQIEVGIPIARFDNYWKVARRDNDDDDDVAGRQAVWGYVARKMPHSPTVERYQ